MSKSCSTACSVGKEGRFSRGCSDSASKRVLEEGAVFSPARYLDRGG